MLTTSTYRHYVTLLVLLTPIMAGCVAWQSYPACNFASGVAHTPRSDQEPINFLHLRQDPPSAYMLGPRDVLGIYIEGVLGESDEAPPVHFSQDGNLPPAVGYPIPVRDDGTVSLPLVPPIEVAGLTLAQTEELIRRAYTVTRQILAADRARILVTLVRPRTYQVLVIREDTTSPSLRRGQAPGELILGSGKRGMVYAVDLPAYENDLLHALSETGGLPGVDATNEVTILRGAFTLAEAPSEARTALFEQSDQPSSQVAEQPGLRLAALLQEVKDSPFQPGAIVADQDGEATLQDQGGDLRRFAPQLLTPALEGGLLSSADVVKIPLRVPPDGPAPDFAQNDIILDTGDVVFIESREAEVFYTGGLLQGGQHPIPRDYDLDILGAIAMAGGSIASAAGGAGGQSAFGRYSGVGALFPPTRARVVRTVNGEQITIRVNLRRALTDPRQRILIEPNDFILLEYKELELILNILLNNLQLNYFLNSLGN